MSLHLNDILVNTTIFPDKTSQVWQVSEIALAPRREMNIEFKFENEGEIFHLCQLVSLIRHKRTPCPINLHMPYLPYGRQDKEVSNESTFALRTFCNILKSLSLDRITTLDAHSGLAGELLDNFESVKPSKEISSALRSCNATAVAFPDAGAWDRYARYDTIIGHHYITGSKVRNQLTGYIEKYDIEGEPEGKTVLIVDDLIDGGMTFKLLARDLYKQGAESVHLYVTHGIFSKGVETLRADGIQRIFTKDGEIK